MSLCGSWATQADLCEPCSDYSVDPTLLEEYLLMASEVLYELSGQQFKGECTETIRPCTQRAWQSVWRNSLTNINLWQTFPPRAMNSAWGLQWVFIGCGCGQQDTCGCGSMSQILLPRIVNEVTEVKIDGVIVDPSLYRLDDNQFLARLDGQEWPCCQDLALADDSPDTFSVSYSYGLAPPRIGVRAAAILACELYMACDPETFEGQCRLPHNVAQVARQGVNILFNQVELLVTRPGQPARFGITEIDIFLRTYNPSGITSPTIVLSPDTPAVGKRTGT